MDESSASLSDNTTYIKSYAEAASGGGVSYDQVRILLKEEEASRRNAALIEAEKKKRERNIIIYGFPESLELLECSQEFLTIAEEFNEKPKVIDICRLGKIPDNNKPRPVRVKLDSKLTKQRIVANAHKLINHSKFNKVYLKPDLSQEERKIQRELWTELKRKISQEPHKRWTRKGNAVVEINSEHKD